MSGSPTPQVTSGAGGTSQPHTGSRLGSRYGDIGRAPYFRQNKLRKRRPGWLMVLPVQLLFAAFFIVPFGYTIYESVTSPLTGHLTGFTNFRFALGSSSMWSAITRVAYFGAIQVTVMVLLALGLAFVIDSPLCVGKRLFRLLYFLPYAVPGVLAAIMWGFLYSPTLDSLLGLPVSLGLAHAPPNPLSSNFVLYAIMLIVTWEWTGYNMTLYLTSLSSIPDAVLDAAVIDGCSQLKLIRYVKLPMIRRMMFFTLVLSVIGTLQLFNEPQIISAITPLPTNYTPNMAIYNEAFNIGNLPLAAAMSLVLGALTVGASLVFYFVWRRFGIRNARASQ